jgi:hypothetical protein
MMDWIKDEASGLCCPLRGHRCSAFMVIGVVLGWLFLKEKVSLVCWSGIGWSFPELPYYRRSADFLG